MLLVKKLLHACLPTRNDRFLWGMVSVVTLAIVAVNALSQLTDAERRGDALPSYFPWITEATSAVFIIMLFPAVAWFVARLPFDSENLKRTVLAHFALSIGFSAIHMAGMVGLRKLMFSTIFGHGYNFFDVLWRDALYEYRKDIVTYILFVSLLYLTQAISRRDEALKQAKTGSTEKRLAFKSGSELIWIKPSHFSFAKAAGNYVELSTGGITHLVRTSMTALEKQFREAGINVLRVHRSYLVNADQIVSIKPKSDGDAEINLLDGTVIPASRRYRDQLRQHGITA